MSSSGSCCPVRESGRTWITAMASKCDVAKKVMRLKLQLTDESQSATVVNVFFLKYIHWLCTNATGWKTLIYYSNFTCCRFSPPCALRLVARFRHWHVCPPPHCGPICGASSQGSGCWNGRSHCAKIVNSSSCSCSWRLSIINGGPDAPHASFSLLNPNN